MNRHAPEFLRYYRSDAGRRFLTRQTAVLAAIAAALLATFGIGDLDRTISGWFFDRTHGGFALTNDWWLKVVLHDAARTAGALGVVALLGATATAWLAPGLARAKSLRHELSFAAAAVLLSAAAVEILKHFSTHACPWDIADFGGLVPYRHLFAAHGTLPATEGCLPAAHPLIGYAWLGVGLALWPRAPRIAGYSMAAALVVGTAAGAVQVLRGAHFLSHVLWTAWVVAAVDIALLTVCRWYVTRVTDRPGPECARRPGCSRCRCIPSAPSRDATSPCA